MKRLRNFAVALLSLGITAAASAQSENQAPNEKTVTTEAVQTKSPEASTENTKGVTQEKVEKKEEATPAKTAVTPQKQATRKEKARSEDKE